MIAADLVLMVSYQAALLGICGDSPSRSPCEQPVVSPFGISLVTPVSAPTHTVLYSTWPTSNSPIR